MLSSRPLQMDRRKTNTLRFSLSPRHVCVVGTVVLFGCMGNDTPVDPMPPTARVHTSNQAAEHARPTEIPFEEIAKDVPGFAGYFLEDGKLIVNVTDLELAMPARSAVITVLDRRHIRIGATPLSSLEILIRPVRYSFRELEVWRDSLFDNVLGRDGVVTLDLDEFRNQVSLGIRDEGDRPMLARRIEDLGIPSEALHIELTGRIQLNSSLRDAVSPFRGGQQIDDGNGACTLGFNARRSGVAVFIMASHCTPYMWYNSGAPLYQPTTAGTLLGYETADPSGWSCGFLGLHTCRYSDAAAIEYADGVNFGFGRIYLTNERIWGPYLVTSDTLGNSATMTISSGTPYATIVDEQSVLYGSYVDKVGRSSGWTYGVVSATCMDVDTGDDLFRMCSGRANYHSLGHDSGAPVFYYAGSGQAYLEGINFASDFNTSTAYFSPVDGIESDLGDLDFATSIDYGPMTAYISGPTAVIPYSPYCTWYANVSGGTGTISYEWSGVRTGTGSSVTGTVPESGYLYLHVTRGGEEWNDSFWVDSYEEAPGCS